MAATIVFNKLFVQAINNRGPCVDFKKNSHLKKIRLNMSGMSLIEVMVALGMAGIASLIIASMMQQTFKTQKQASIIANIEEMRQTIQKLILDGTAWRATVAQATNAGGSLNCVALNSTCTDSGATSLHADDHTQPNSVFEGAQFIDLLHLEKANGGSYINTEGAGATAGWTEKGAPCGGWSAAGNDACPIHWRIRIAYECQTPPTCINPTVRVIALLYYRPSPGSSTSVPIAEAKYRVDVRRGAKGDARAEKFRVSYVLPNTAGTTGGACTPSIFIPFNEATGSPTYINEGSPANVTYSPGTGAMTFAAGTYTCSASSSCFACGSLKIALNVNGVDIATSNSVASNRWETSNVSLHEGI